MSKLAPTPDIETGLISESVSDTTQVVPPKKASTPVVSAPPPILLKDVDPAVPVVRCFEQ